jgi:hypothetical protein
MLATAWRQMDGLLQLESNRVDTRARDRDTLPALAWAIRLLENSTPTNSYYKLKLHSTAMVANRSYIDNPNPSSNETKYFKIEYTAVTGGYTIKVTPINEADYNILAFEIVNEYAFPTS